MQVTEALEEMLPMATHVWMLKFAQQHRDGNFEWKDCAERIAQLPEQTKIRELLTKNGSKKHEACPPDMMMFDNLIGDVVPPKGVRAILFNLIAEALALLSFCPYGVEFGEHRFEAATQTMGLFTGWNEPILCRKCKKELKKESSRAKGIGPVCEHKERELKQILNLMASATEHVEENLRQVERETPSSVERC